MKYVGLPVALLSVFALALGACGGDDEEGGQASGDRQVLRIVVGSDPPSLDPGLVTDTISANFLLNIMDPLVKLGDDLEPVPTMAERWDMSKDGKTITFHLRSDGKWTNGDQLTARDYEYAWKRMLDPKLAAGYAYQFYGIVGAQDYNGCKKNCTALRDKVGVKALDDRTLEVKLTAAQPWFLQQMAHTSFLPAHRATVEKFGRRWTEPKNIVTSGPFRVTAWKHDELITLEKWADWRGADSVALDRIEGKIISDSTTALQAFDANEVDACLEDACIPAGEIDRVKDTEEYVKVPGLATQYYGINVKTVADVNQRRALALALDRQSIVDDVTKAGETPATSFTPEGMPGYDVIKQDSLSAEQELDAAKEFLGKAKNAKRRLNVVYAAGGPNQKEIAVATQAMWQELGIATKLRGMEWAQLLEAITPHPDKEIDVIEIGWVGDYVDDINFLELFTCTSGNNLTNYCNPEYDKLLAKARTTADDDERYKIYEQLEAILTGPEGDFPVIPIHWPSFITLRKTNVEGWAPSALDYYDFTKVSIKDE